jgi:uncharacterized protein (TIGR03083 family)
VSDESDSPRSEPEPIVAMLVEEWAALAELLDGLAASEWLTPTALPGWSVHDVVAHLIGTESRLSGDEEPPSLIDVTTLAHVRNAIGGANERWVRALHSEPPEEMRLRFRDVSRRRADMLIAMSREDFDVPTQTPVGQAPYRRFMEIRVFDCWMHEQDIRQAIEWPGHEDGPCAEVSIDEIVRALGFIIGKQAAVPDGSTVTVNLVGPVHRTIHVAVNGRAEVVSQLDRPATTTLRLPSTVFARLAGGRADALSGLDAINFDGNPALGRRVVENLAFTI